MCTPHWPLSFCDTKTPPVLANNQPRSGKLLRIALFDHCMEDSGTALLQEQVLRPTIRLPALVLPGLIMHITEFRHQAAPRTFPTSPHWNVLSSLSLSGYWTHVSPVFLRQIDSLFFAVYYASHKSSLFDFSSSLIWEFFIIKQVPTLSPHSESQRPWYLYKCFYTEISCILLSLKRTFKDLLIVSTTVHYAFNLNEGRSRNCTLRVRCQRFLSWTHLLTCREQTQRLP